ncbi:MAG: chromosomal replication initiator protein DnaA [Patescibacteria group bacterium]
MDTKQLWDKTLQELESVISKANFTTWFKDTYILRFEDNIIFLSVPNAFVQEWLFKKFHHVVLKILRDISSSIHSLEYIISKDERKKNAIPVKPIVSAQRSMPLSDYYINKDDNLNPRYTFESFVVGPFNELANAAAQAVIKNLGLAYNPFFVYGSTGHGKTHLIQAVGNFVKSHHPSKKVFYMTSEKFAVDFVNSLQANKVNVFKEKYRKYDMLIMDDIQFFTGKPKVQEELFHLFNTFYDNNRQIIFSADKHPNLISDIEARLKSRFGAGMIVDIPEPDYESRISIIRSKFMSNGFMPSPESINFLAKEVAGNIRDIEGIINSIVVQTELKKREVNINEIKELIKNNVKQKKTLSYKEVVKIVSEFYKIDEESIYEKTRRKEVIKPRQIIMYILREDFSISYPSIGEKMGGRDHTTVIHSCEKIKKDIKLDDVLLGEIQQIRTMIV